MNEKYINLKQFKRSKNSLKLAIKLECLRCKNFENLENMSSWIEGMQFRLN